MRKIIKVFCILVFLFLIGCEKTEIPSLSHAAKYMPLLQHLKCQPANFSVKEMSSDELLLQWMEEDDITGTWQLLLDFSAGDTVDYSCATITYSFNANGTVRVESNVKEWLNGQFEYSYYSDPFCPLCLPEPNVKPNLIIGENRHYCQVVKSWLTVFSCVELGEDRRNRGEVERILYKIN
jgi:hypothetical protein